MAEPSIGQERGVFTGMKRKTLALIALVVAATITVGAFYTRRGDEAPAFTTEAVSRGDIVGDGPGGHDRRGRQPGVGHDRVAERGLQFTRETGAGAGEAGPVHFHQ